MGSMANSESTSTLVERARAGDREAFGEISRRFRPRLEEQIRSRMGDAAKAKLEPEDVLSETFTCALESIERLEWRGEETFYRWLGSIAEHVIRHAVRKKGWGQLGLELDVPASGVSPSRNLRREERLKRLEHALSALHPDYRKAVFLSRIEGLKVREIAERMDRSPDAVKKLLARGLAELKNSFGDTESLRLPERRINVEGAGDE